MPFLLLLAIAGPVAPAPIDFQALDEAIEHCQRDSVLPVFAAEAQSRSAFITAAYSEQAEISAERATLASKRQSIRAAALRPSLPNVTPPKPVESDQELALAQLALEDRQRALDDRRRLETMRQEAIDLKRQYFLLKCASSKKKAD